MSDGYGSVPAGSWDHELLERLDLDVFAVMFDDHAAYVFDYCRALAGRDDVAAEATEAALISAQSVAEDPGRLRASLFAVARRKVLAADPSGTDGWGNAPLVPLPGFATDDPESTNPGSGPGDLPLDEGQRAFSAPPGSDREILSLVYRYGIHPYYLAVVLGLHPYAANEMLIAAELALERADSDLSIEQLAGGALASVPRSVWRHSIQAVLAADRPHAGRLGNFRGAMARPAFSRRRAMTAVAAGCAMAIVGIGVYFAGPSHTVGSPTPLTSTADTGSGALGSALGASGAPASATPSPSVTSTPATAPNVPPVTKKPSPKPSTTPATSPPPTSPPPSSPPPSSPPPSSPPPTSPPPSPTPTSS